MSSVGYSEGGASGSSSSVQTSAAKKQITQLWGKAKRIYIQKRQRQFQDTPDEALDAWKEYRRSLPKTVSRPARNLLDENTPLPEYDYHGFTDDEDDDDPFDLRKEQVNPEEAADFGLSEGNEQTDMASKRPAGTRDPTEEDLPSRETEVSQPPDESTVPMESEASAAGISGGGGISAGRADTMGGTGGGLAGAGNNAMFKGFGGATRPMEGYVKQISHTYKRSFAVHTNFEPPATSVEAATLSFDLDPTPDKTIEALEKYDTDFVHASCDHTLVMVPYNNMEASMKTCDWNMPPEFVSYKLKKFGFNMPNMRLQIMNNDRTNTTQVAPAPPANARMFTFVDVYNDYGIPATHIDQYSHSAGFIEEDMVQASQGRYALPQLKPRNFELPVAAALQLMGEPGWSYDATGRQATHTDPNMMYDLKRHDGYNEFRLETASMGLTYIPKMPAVRFPMPPVTSLDWTDRIRDTDTSGFMPEMTNDHDQTYVVHQWECFWNFPMQNIPHDSSAMEDATAVYYTAAQPYYAKNLTTTDPMTTDEFTAAGLLGQFEIRPPTTQFPECAKATRRNTHTKLVTDEGAKVGKSITKRPPLFCIGVHKELEYQSDGPKFWRYELVGQVEYFSQIEWTVDTKKFKPYLHIGLGGVYRNATEYAPKYDSEGRPTNHGRIFNLKRWKNIRERMTPISNTTDVEGGKASLVSNVERYVHTF